MDTFYDVRGRILLRPRSWFWFFICFFQSLPVVAGAVGGVVNPRAGLGRVFQALWERWEGAVVGRGKQLSTASISRRLPWPSWFGRLT